MCYSVSMKLIARQNDELATTYPRKGVAPRPQEFYILTPGKEYTAQSVDMNDGEIYVEVKCDDGTSRRLNLLRFALQP